MGCEGPGAGEGNFSGRREAKVMVDLVWGHIRDINRHVVTDVRGGTVWVVNMVGSLLE